MPKDPVVARNFQRLVISSGVFGLAISLVVMLTWFLNPQLFIKLLPQSATMKFNTALLFGFTSIGILFFVLPDDSSYKKVFNFLVLAIICIAALTIFSYLLNMPTFILDELIVRDPLTAMDHFPGRMSLATAFLFMLLGLSILIIERFPRLSESIAATVNLMALTALFAFLFDVDALYNIFFFSTVSFHTAFLFVLLSMAVVLMNPGGFIIQLMKLNEPGGIVLRWLMPIVLLIPFGVGWLILQGLNYQLYGSTFAVTLSIITIVGLQAMMGIYHAHTIQKWYKLDQIYRNQLLENKMMLLELENTRQLQSLKDEFFTKLSHDLRTPITSIVNSSEIIINYESKLTLEKRIRYLMRIKNQALSMLDFVDDIMLLSRLELDELPFNPRQGDIVTYCNEFLPDLIEALDYEENHILQIIPSQDVIMLNFDEKLMRRLLINLISNAVKYSPDGGSIVVTIQATVTDVVISVCDEGVGIPAEDIEGLFELFHRASNVDAIKGHGIGLSIIKQIVNLHKGHIRVESVQGEGTTFIMNLPDTVSVA